MSGQRDWTIVQFLYREPCPVSESRPAGWTSRCERYVAETPLKSEATRFVEAWLAEHPGRGENLSEVNYFPRNYVSTARDLRLAGRVIARPAPRP